MDRIYLISYDGRIFYVEPNSNSFEYLDVNSSNEEHQIKIKKLSPSERSLWTICSSFEVKLIVLESDIPIEYQECTYENQRRYNLLSANSFTNKLLPSDRYNFSSIDGILNLPKESFQLPSDSWVWESDWFHDQNASEGWEYAVDFPTHYRPKIFIGACVRRKKWMRNRLFTNYNKFISLPSPKKDDCIIEIITGGYEMEYCEKGFLSVWIISNSGKLYFRKDVSFKNVEGSCWLKVKLPKENDEALSCSCSSLGSFSVITFSGEVLIRQGVSREEPYGRTWIKVEQPSIETSLRQISMSSKSIWGLDNTGTVFFRSGICAKTPEGLKWVQIPSNMSNISVSRSSQLWAIDVDENSLYFRNSIDEENPSGIGWKKIHIKCKRTYKAKTEEEYSQSDLISANDLSNETDSNFYLQSNNSNNDNATTDLNNNNTETENKNEQLSNEIYTEGSIYDDPNDSSSTSADLLARYAIKQEIHVEKNKDDSFDVKKLVKQNKYNVIITDFDKLSKGLDSCIEDIKEAENQEEIKSQIAEKNNQMTTEAMRTERTDSFASLTSSKFNFNLATATETSSFAETNKSEASFSMSELENEFVNVSFKIVAANISSINSNSIQMSWFNRNIYNKNINENEEMPTNDEPIVELWRNSLLDEIVKRNLREYGNVDKISIPFENSSWSCKEDFMFFNGKNVVTCHLEIVTQQKTKSSEFDACLEIKLSNSKKSQIIDFDSIICANRWSCAVKPNTPCFALFTKTHSKTPHVFLSSSENKLKDWTNQISIYLTKLSGINSLKYAHTLVDLNGNAYFGYFDRETKTPKLFQQIEGHLKTIEKHSSGMTYGIGQNGKLWYLNKSNANKILESYNGPYIQQDDFELYTYENQRWNAIYGALSGVTGNHGGFKSPGLPTDRPNWSDETGKIKRRIKDIYLPTSQFTWANDWQVDYSTPDGADKDGWQYALDFPRAYHSTKTPFDFVRRRRWSRKCRIKVKSLWQDIQQSHRLTSIALDQENMVESELPDNIILVVATDTDGFVLRALVNKSTPLSLKWIRIQSDQRFKYVTIDSNLKLWGIDIAGKVYLRYGVKKEDNFCGINWSLIEDKDEIKFKMLSAGSDCLWGVSMENDLYYRDNITKSFPEGTNWTKIGNSKISYVTCNIRKEVMAIKEPEGNLIFLDNSNAKSILSNKWLEIATMKLTAISNKGINK